MKENLQRITVSVLVIMATLGGRSAAASEPVCPVAVKDIPAVQKPNDGPAKLARGVNLSRWWEDEHDRALSPEDVRKIPVRGFDFVRLPVSPTWLADDNADTKAAQLAKLRCDIVTLLSAGLKVVVDLHPSGDFDEKFQKLNLKDATVSLRKYWQAMVPAIDGLPPSLVVLELYNEPHFDSTIWWKIQGSTLGAMRRLYPLNTLVATASPDSGAWNLTPFLAYKDKNVIYDFHFYEPLGFTHHGVEWADDYKPEQAALPMPYPVDKHFNYATDDPEIGKYVADDWNRGRVEQYIDEIADWQKKNHAQLVCLEFGVYRPHLDASSRVNWLRDTREALEKNDIPWAVWEYHGPFGLIPEHGNFDEDMASALGLGHTAAR